jgi:uncharacterized repeat protein (TIGR01451 family)
MKRLVRLLLGFTAVALVGLIAVHSGGQQSSGRSRLDVVAPGQANNGAADTGPVYTPPVASVLSPRLGDLPVAEPADLALDREINPRIVLNPITGELPELDPNWRDPAVPEPGANNLLTPPLLLDFEGMNRSVGGASPPDTIGVVGPDYFIELVNATYLTVYDKTDGSIVQGPIQLNDLWTGNDGCEQSNSGDPVITYDWLADRWVMAQFGQSFSSAICVAVSASADPLGSYHTYRFNFGSFPDYFKIGTWSDAYYVGANQSGLNVHALNRAAMLAGQPASVVSFAQAGVNVHSMLLPASLDGHTPPPAGAPNIYHRFIDGDLFGGVDRIELFEFHVDFTTPANSTWTGPIQLPSASFASLCNFSFNCIVQPGTSQRLDSITEWPMWRFQYRNFGTHETLVSNHAVNVGSNQSGVRWFELRRSGGGAWSIYQESTLAPDAHNRWMASVAMDGDGNLALGYSISSASVFPGLRYAGRLATDPLNTLQAEQVHINGGGSQTGLNRWGDYSALTVDPEDDCTFWYVGEYYAATASNNWQSRIGAFKFPECGATVAAADMAIDKTVDTQTGQIGQPITYTLTITNYGPDEATGVTVVDTLPPAVAFVSAGASQGSCSETGGTVTCSLGTMVNQAVATVAIVVTPVEAGQVVNAAQVSADQEDGDNSNNTAQAAVNIYFAIYLPLVYDD